jgi:hypothetical protein
MFIAQARGSPGNGWSSNPSGRRTSASACDVVLGIGIAGQQRDPLAAPPAVDAIADLVDLAPAFVARRARFQRVLEPGTARPHRQVGRAYAAAMQSHAYLPGRG